MLRLCFLLILPTPPPATTTHPHHYRDRQVLNIPFDLLKEMPEGPITLTVSVRNIFGVQTSSSLTFRKKNATEAPLFELDHSRQRFFPSVGFRVDAEPLPSGCPNTKVGRQCLKRRGREYLVGSWRFS